MCSSYNKESTKMNSIPPSGLNSGLQGLNRSVGLTKVENISCSINLGIHYQNYNKYSCITHVCKINLPQALHRVRVFPVAGSTLCRGLGWWEDSLGRFPRLEGLITYGEPHKSHLNGIAGSRRGTLRRGFSRLLLFFFVWSSSSDGDWNRIGFLFLSRSLDLLLSMSSEEPFKQCKELWMS